MKVGIVGQRGNHRAVSLVGDITERLQRASVDVGVDEATHDEFQRGGVWHEAGTESTEMPRRLRVEELADCDLAVSVGGDGTFLYTARGAGGTPILGVNLGEVGFLNAVSPAAAVDAVQTEVERIRDTGSPRYREMPRLQAVTDDWALPPALNEIVVQGPQRGHGNGVSIEVRVDGSLYTSGRADGVLISTATGSTAYNLSEGGPLVHPDVDGLVVTEMCDAEGMPPLVVDTDVAITVRVDDTTEAIAVSDGRVQRSIAPPGEIRVSRAEIPVRIAGPPLDFFTALGKLE
jgi:NAD+ kinase